MPSICKINKDNFLSEAGGVLTFFASFFVLSGTSRFFIGNKKMKWGLGQSPSLLNSSDNQHILYQKQLYNWL
jgi:hypothetical protein